MKKEKLINIIGFTGLVLYAIGFLAFILYKLVFAPYYNLSEHHVGDFAGVLMITQSILLTLLCISLLKDLASEKKWYNQVLIYIFAFIAIYGVTGGIMSVVDFLSGRPFVVL